MGLFHRQLYPVGKPLAEDMAGYSTFGDFTVDHTDAYTGITWAYQGAGIWQIDIANGITPQANPKDASTTWFKLKHPATGEILDWSSTNLGFITLVLEVVDPLSAGDDVAVSLVHGDGDWSSSGKVVGGGVLYESGGPTANVWKWASNSLTNVEDATPSTAMRHSVIRAGQKTVIGDGNIIATGLTTGWAASSTADFAQTWANQPIGTLLGINCRPDADPGSNVSIKVRPRYSLHLFPS